MNEMHFEIGFWYTNDNYDIDHGDDDNDDDDADDKYNYFDKFIICFRVVELPNNF